MWIWSTKIKQLNISTLWDMLSWQLINWIILIKNSLPFHTILLTVLSKALQWREWRWGSKWGTRSTSLRTYNFSQESTKRVTSNKVRLLRFNNRSGLKNSFINSISSTNGKLYVLQDLWCIWTSSLECYNFFPLILSLNDLIISPLYTSFTIISTVLAYFTHFK